MVVEFKERKGGLVHADEQDDDDDDDDDENDEDNEENLSTGSDDDDSSEESEWSGLSDTDRPSTASLDNTTLTTKTVKNSNLNPQAPEIYDYRTFTLNHLQDAEILDKASYKKFMSSKPPTSSTPGAPNTAKPSRTSVDTNKAEDQADLLNASHDATLSRLLHTSDLLTPSGASQSTPKSNHALLQRLLSTNLPQPSEPQVRQKMPISHARGIAAKQLRAEQTRRREAREAGIILERPNGTNRSGNGDDRERKKRRTAAGISAPGIGKFERGSATVRLSERDVSAIQGSGGGGREGGKGRGGGRGGRGKGRGRR